MNRCSDDMPYPSGLKPQHTPQSEAWLEEMPSLMLYTSFCFMNVRAKSFVWVKIETNSVHHTQNDLRCYLLSSNFLKSYFLKK